MRSRLPKVLHRVCGRELIRYPVELLRQAGIQRSVVVLSSENGPAVRRLIGEGVEYVTQPAALGTADALTWAAGLLRGQAQHLLVLGADSPLVRAETVMRLIASHLDKSSDMTLLTASAASTRDLGRVVRDGLGRIVEIVEATERGETPDSPGEINGGVYSFQASWLWDNLDRIEPSPSGERYLTSLAARGAATGAARESSIQAVVSSDPWELQGVNDRLQLAQVEAVQRQRIRNQWMLAGVTMLDPSSVFIDADVTLGQDTVLLPNTMLLGRTTIGEGCEIGPGSIIRDSKLGRGCRATASMLEEATMEDNSNIGPFSHLRPGAYLETGVHIGNFVEVKESRFCSGAVMGHFGYVGDASIGANVNLGAGVVTCNYDGETKHRTIIEAGAFIGCDTMLVAPVTIGAEAVTGAGSVVLEDVPPGRLAVGVPAKIMDIRLKAG
jgi:bifunctional UDP-N-acetylglucosamine pyrophosphorylase/glucosamine-1-phosphate N-acetyltransferase